MNLKKIPTLKATFCLSNGFINDVGFDTELEVGQK